MKTDRSSSLNLYAPMLIVQRADELIVGLPISFDGKETAQSKKTRSFTGKLAAQAAQR